MERYKNLSGTSGVEAYRYGVDYIVIKFKEGRQRFYKYTHRSAGAQNILQMKGLAERGHGLNSFINLNVKYQFESKW